MPYKVLVAIDNIGLSELVIDALSTQAQPEQDEIKVVQVIDPALYSVPSEISAGYEPGEGMRRKELQEEAKHALSLAEDRVKKAGFNVTSRMVETDPEEGILDVATEWGANLIIVTSHARKRMEKFFHHSVAQAIVQRAACSVLVLKERDKQAAA